MEGFEVNTIESSLGKATSTSPPPATRTCMTLEHMQPDEGQAIVCNIGHFDNEIQVDKLNASGRKRTNIKPQVDKYTFPDGRVRSSCWPKAASSTSAAPPATRRFVMSNSFSNQTLAQIDLWANKDTYKAKVYILPKKLDEEVARLHLEKIGVKLTTLTKPSRPSTSACRWKAPTSRSTTATESFPASPPAASRRRDGTAPWRSAVSP
jgi:adenosylhomocysteinase